MSPARVGVVVGACVLTTLALGAAIGVWWKSDHPAHSHSPGEETALAATHRYTCPMHPQVVTDHPGTCPICGMQLARLDENRDGAAPEPRVLYWYDPMKPEVHFDRPGKSPFMDMALVPKYAEPAGAGIAVDPRMRQSLGIRTATVARGAIVESVRAVGTLAFDERQFVAVEARSAGWLESLVVSATDTTVRAGAPIARVYAPEIDATFAELALAEQHGDAELASAARARLRVFGLAAGAVEAGSTRGAGRYTLTLTAPRSGVVTELNARPGQQITPGTVVARIAGLDPVWLQVDVPEGAAALLGAGHTVRATFSAFPGKAFTGQVEHVYAAADRDTRTLRARVALANPDFLLRPGMTAEVELAAPTQEALLVPSAAIIRTGTRTVVLVAEADGHFRPTAVTVGRDSGDATAIESGLTEGQSVVVSGQFLIDSEASLQSALGRYAPPHAELQPVQPGGTLRYRSPPDAAQETPR